MKRSRLKLSPKEYRALSEEVMTRDGHRCRSCKFRNDLHLHHIKFRSQGGDDSAPNTISLCSVCHSAIHDRNLLIVSPSGVIDGEVDANSAVRFIRLHGWKPSH